MGTEKPGCFKKPGFLAWKRHYTAFNNKKTSQDPATYGMARH